MQFPYLPYSIVFQSPFDELNVIKCTEKIKNLPLDRQCARNL